MKEGSIKSPKIPLLILVAILALDFGTKYLARSFLRQIHSLTIIPNFFNLTYVENRGAAFGFLAETNARFRTPFFVFISLVAILVIIILYRREEGGAWGRLALIFILGGALGNMVDRLRFGWVIDFLDFHWYHYHWPAFNVADIAICIGVGMLMINMFSGQKGRKPLASNTF